MTTASTLYDIAHVLDSVTEPEQRIDRALALLEHLVPYDRCALLDAAADPSCAMFVVHGVSGAQRDALAPRLEALLAMVSEHPSTGGYPLSRSHQPHLAVPIISIAGATGILFVERDAGHYDESHLALLSTVAAQLGSYLAAMGSHREMAAMVDARDRDVHLLEMFMGILGHDLRNPLSAIRIAIDHIRIASGNHFAPIVRRMMSSTDRMERMVAQLLDLTRIRLAGGIPVNVAPADLARLCRNAIDELTEIHPAAVIDVAIDGDTAGQWDADRLLQAVSNLVGNAIEHATDIAGITLRLAGTGDSVTLEIHNPGAIPPDLLGVLFDPFRGAHLTASRKGLGLGLFITKHIVEAHHGTITVDSAEPRGTTFSVTLPRHRRT